MQYLYAMLKSSGPFAFPCKDDIGAVPAWHQHVIR